VKPRSILKVGTAVLVTGLTTAAMSIAHADGLSYPDSKLSDVISQEEIEAKHAEELESKAAIERDTYEHHVKEVEQKITAHKYNIENLKMRQEKAQSEIEDLNVAIKDVDGQIDGLSTQSAKLEEDTQRTTEYLDTLRTDLANRQKALSDKMVAMQKQRQDSENVIYMKSVEVQRMKTEVAQAETKVQEAEATRAALEADEMATRTTWMQTKLNISDKYHQRDEALAAEKESQVKHDKAMADLNVARVELAKAEKIRSDISKKSSADIARYENDIMQASKNRVSAEAERIRLETEANKLQDYASRVRTNRDQAVAEAADAGSMVLRTKVAVETARTELAATMNSTDQAIAKKQKAASTQRGLASAQEAADLYSGARRWVSTMGCKAYAHPKVGGPSDNYSSGSRVMAREYDNPDWVEVISGSGVSEYLQSKCGHFEN
jgi:predicted  nucleic acid-binding Zn-ribbon protein